MITAPTPKELGNYMPAEWEEHEATWLAWPNPRLKYWGERLAGVEKIYAQMVEALHRSEKVHMQVYDAEMERDVKQKLQRAKVPLDHIVFFETKNMDVWTRDHGPIFVKNGSGDIAITHWMFNGWGRYNDLAADTSVPARIHELTGLPYFNAGIVLEGGSIEVNGDGTIITTEQCLYHKNRNPFLSQEEITQRLEDFLGVDEILLLKKGLYKDDTAGHVDNIMRFVGPKRVVCVEERDRKDKNYRHLKRNKEAMVNEGFDVVSLPTPGVVKVDGERRAASYANFYIGNKVVLAPIFWREQDAEAVGILHDEFPERRIVPINCLDLVASGGTIHCVTQQQPKGKNWSKLMKKVLGNSLRYINDD